MKRIIYNFVILITTILLLFNFTGCGKKSMPIPEDLPSEEMS